MKNILRVSLLSAVCVSAMTSAANAASFYLQEQSVSGLGTAFAGAQADTEDASTIFYNPAGMTNLGSAQAYLGASVLMPDAKFKNQGSTATTGGTGGLALPLTGSNGGNPFSVEALPHAYIAAPLFNDRFWAGVGVTAPFGLSNDFSDDFVGRYNSSENMLKTIDIEPTMAWKATDWLSVGAGVSFQYATADLKNAIPSPATVGGPTVATDGVTRLKGDDWATGFNFGILLKPIESTKIGFNYREGVSHTLKGRVTNRLPANIGGAVIDVPGNAELDLPDIASVAVSHKLDDKWTLLGSVNWYRWSNFDDIPIQAGAPVGFKDQVQDYRNTWGAAIGARYKLNDKWTLKGGLQFDQTPTVDDHRTTRIPDGNRVWLAGGATYDITPQIGIDFSGAYVKAMRDSIDIVDAGAATGSTHTKGHTEGDVGIVAAAVKFKF